MQCKFLIVTALIIAAPAAFAGPKDWPAYNRTLTSDRYATIETIDNTNVAGLKVLCSFDTGEQMAFQSGLVQADGSLFATTDRDTISIDPNTRCTFNAQSSP